ncbi:NADH:flavin oxidoreductase/NADH oxidase [Thermoanaerobacter ethanolicus JW 200]|nr:NADH:flavin oxidoreductase/NADH oxidase [Thermoanaerobacter ethanolicus JW 200]
MEDPELASSALEEGKADAIVIGRGLLADPQLPNKIKSGKVDDIRPCLGCHDGCMGRIAQVKPLCCAVNPQVGREAEYGVKPAEKQKCNGYRRWSSRHGSCKNLRIKRT